MSTDGRTTSRLVDRICVVGLLVVLCFLAGFSIFTERRLARESASTAAAARLGIVYADARFWVGQEESLARKYRLEPSPAVRAMHASAEARLSGDLHAVLRVDRSDSTQRFIAGLLQRQAVYEDTTLGMFSAVDAPRTSKRISPALAAADAQRVTAYDHAVVDPIFAVLQAAVYDRSESSARQARRQSDALAPEADSATKAIAVGFGLGLMLLGMFSVILVRFRRRADAAGRAEVARLAAIVSIDSLTSLRNHRAFHEDLARELQRIGRTRSTLALILLDLDGLKHVNDTLGHQAGDERLTALADGLAKTLRASDSAYRVGGDEFAVILAGERAWGALEVVQRLQVMLADQTIPIGVTAGIAEAVCPRDKDSLIREADRALIVTKHRHQSVAIYTPELESQTAARDAAEDMRYADSLASALAHAVDAKDSYTRSHCETVSQLCALLAVELRLAPQQIDRMRLAGLLHDVGKIGIPDAILKKPARLSEAEYDQMKRHSLLGEEIIAAADLPREALWVRHHHERYDGTGYPDGLAAEDIPLESRIILVSDAFEAMTSDRPYRKAPGRDFAIAELRRNAGTQFDTTVVLALCRVLESPANPSDIFSNGSEPELPGTAPRRGNLETASVGS